jgi:predicted DNA-binding antitoxin AbrB/MazE fold protein
MNQQIRAIFEYGHFRPLDPVSLADHEVVSLVVMPTQPVDSVDEVLREQRHALREMFEEADSLPLENPAPGFSGADHDQVLYGWKK